MPSIEGLLYNPYSSSFLHCRMQQQWADLAVWEEFLNHVKDIKSFIELGTGYCGLATFFLLQCIQRCINFRTFDIKDNSRLNLPVAKLIGLREHFVQGDIFASPELVGDSIKNLPKPLLLFCDNGDKPREFRTFVPMLASGDYVATHDWPSEINEDHVAGFSIHPIMSEGCEVWKSMTRFWRIK